MHCSGVRFVNRGKFKLYQFEERLMRFVRDRRIRLCVYVYVVMVKCPKVLNLGVSIEPYHAVKGVLYYMCNDLCYVSYALHKPLISMETRDLSIFLTFAICANNIKANL